MASKAAPMAAEEQIGYCTHLRADITTQVSETPLARVHAVEWRKVMAGEPVEINPTLGHGYKVMTVDEWTGLWKRNDDFPDCLRCGSTKTKEHHFIQSWCRGHRDWESETLCMDCHTFSWRSYRDPEFKTPEQFEKERWEAAMATRPKPVAA